MLCLLIKCGTLVGFSKEFAPRSTELYMKNLTSCLSDSSTRALPWGSSERCCRLPPASCQLGLARSWVEGVSLPEH